MRKRYLDILRLICVVLLIPFHTMMMYNTWGEGQYVPGVPLEAASWFLRLSYPWLMPLMFVIAGMSARYSLQKRTPAKYVTERLMRIGLPLLTGILLITPLLSYIADVSNNGYSGGYIAHYATFFTKLTDFSGYDGGFGLAHLWFLLFLFIISLAALPVFLLGKKFPRFMEWGKWPVALILGLGVVQALADDVLNFGGKSLAQYFVLFLIGLFVLSHEEVQAKLERFRFAFLASVFVVGTGYAFALGLGWSGFVYDMLYYLFGYLAMLALLGFGRRHLNMENKVFVHAAASSQLYYILHYPILTAAAYLLMPHIPSVPAQIAIFIAVTLVLTIFFSETVRRIPGVRVLLGVKYSKQDNQNVNYIN